MKDGSHENRCVHKTGVNEGVFIGHLCKQGYIPAKRDIRNPIGRNSLSMV